MNEPSKGVLLVVDDEPLKRATLRMELEQAGYTVLDAADGGAALGILQSRPVDVVISDIRMYPMDGLQLFEEVRRCWPRTHVILMTAYASVPDAVAAIKRGAYDYLTKPFATVQLLERLERLRISHGWPSTPLPAEEAVERIGGLVGRSPASCRLFRQIRELAADDRHALITGEPGAGKSAAAAAIHQLSRRAGNGFFRVAVDGCPPGELEPALLRGLDACRGGTLVVTGIDGLSPDGQQLLLRILSDHRTAQLDVRWLGTGRQDPEAAVREGRLRQDLLALLGQARLAVPPLRERRSDIPLLAAHFLSQEVSCRADGGGPRELSPQAADLLLDYRWPGNVRELAEIIAQAAAGTTAGILEARDIRLPVESAEEPARGSEVLACASLPMDRPYDEVIAGYERAIIDAALRQAAGNQARAAQFLGIPRTTLRDKMAKYGMAGVSARRRSKK